MVKVKVPLLELVCVAPGKEILVTSLLSETTAVNVMVLLWSEVLSSIAEAEALFVKLWIVGFWSSSFWIVKLTSSVTLFPAASVTVIVCVSLLYPQE